MKFFALFALVATTSAVKFDYQTKSCPGSSCYGTPYLAYPSNPQNKAVPADPIANTAASLLKPFKGIGKGKTVAPYPHGPVGPLEIAHKNGNEDNVQR